MNLEQNQISLIMRSARKFKGITQQELAKALDCSQSALSKMENGVLIPSAPQWFSFCEITDIPVKSLVRGFIDRNLNAEVVSEKIANGHNIPTRYLHDRGLKVKYINPFLKFIKSEFGEVELQMFLKSRKLTADFFVDFDNQISLNFLYDIYRYLGEKNATSTESIDDLTEFLKHKEVHGKVFSALEKAKNPLDALATFATNYRNYQADFYISTKNKKERSIVFQVKPKLHIRRFKIFKDAEFQKFCLEFYLMSLQKVSDICKQPSKLNFDIQTNWFEDAELTKIVITY